MKPCDPTDTAGSDPTFSATDFVPFPWHTVFLSPFLNPCSMSHSRKTHVFACKFSSSLFLSISDCTGLDEIVDILNLYEVLLISLVGLIC